MVGNRYFLVYDCRDYQGAYLGRILLVYGSCDSQAFDENNELKFSEVRGSLDASRLFRACSWRIKEVDSSCLMDLCEEFG